MPDGSKTRWTISVSKQTDIAVRSFLAQRGLKKGRPWLNCGLFTHRANDQALLFGAHANQICRSGKPGQSPNCRI